jgi:hypothetical protein
LLLLKWAIQGENTPAISAEKQQVSQVGAVKGAVKSDETGFASAVAAIMSLPLSDAEKAEAVRRLLGAKGVL